MTQGAQLENALIITSAGDIPAAVSVAETLRQYKVYIVDPTLLERVSASPLQNIQLVNWENCLAYPELERWSHSEAFEIERKLDAAVGELLPGISICSWQHLSLYYLLMALRWYRNLWNEVLGDLPDSKYYVFVCDNPSYYYLPSFVPALMLLEYLTAHGSDYSAFSYGKKPNDSDIVPDLFRASQAEQYEILAHLPTCFYDHPYFNEELRSTGKSVISLESKYWSVPVAARATVGLTRIGGNDAALTGVLGIDSESVSRRIAEVLELLLAPYIGSLGYRTLQAQSLADLYKAQITTYFLLKKYFNGKNPSKVLLSDHDAGFHGPIVSFAQHHGIPVLLLPHSKGIGDIEFDGDLVTCLSHPIQGYTISDRQGKKVPTFPLLYPEKFVGGSAMPQRIKRIGLLLNGLSLNGILGSRYLPYLGGIKEIARWCEANGIELGIRCRPGQSLVDIIAGETGISTVALRGALAVSMADFASGHDLCLMYGSPTTAALEFLRNSIPILNPIPQDLSRSELNTVNSKVVPRASVAATLEMLDGFVADGVNFCNFRNAQFREYLNLFGNAFPLRHFL